MKTTLAILLATAAVVLAVEVTNEVRTVRVRMMCDCIYCTGEMLPSPGGFAVLAVNRPLQYPHTCNKCGCSRTFATQYPVIQHEDVETTKAGVTIFTNWASLWYTLDLTNFIPNYSSTGTNMGNVITVSVGEDGVMTLSTNK